MLGRAAQRLDSRWPLLASPILALGLGALWLAWVRPVPVSDFETYRVLAEGLLDHGQFGWPEPSAFRLPGYPVLLAGLMAVSRSIAWLSFGNVVLCALAAICVYLATWRLSGGSRPAAGLAALACAANPTFVFFSPVLASEHLASPLLILALAAAARPDSTTGPHWRPGVTAGLLLGTAALCRGEALFALPLIVALTARPWVGPSSIARAAATLLVFGLVVTPWTVRNQLVIGPGTGLSSSAGLNFYYAHNPHRYGWDGRSEGLRGDVRGEHVYPLAWQHIKGHPLNWPWDAVEGTINLYRPSGYAVSWSAPPGDADQPGVDLPGRWLLRAGAMAAYVLLLGMAGLGGLMAWRSPILSQSVRILAAALALQWIGYAVIFWGAPRYRYTTEMLLCILLGVGFAAATTRVREKRSSPADDVDAA